MFSEEKAAQVAAYLLQHRGGQMSYLKLMKLMYLADRASMAEYGFPISDDAWFSMKLGPVLSNTLELVQGGGREGEWDDWVRPGDQAYEIELSRVAPERDDFDELSDAEIEILDRVWVEHGHKTRWQLVDYTHEACAEWHDPYGSSRPISPQEMLEALGRSPEEASALSQELYQRRQVKEVMSELR
ncbi:Panacea domain-containing protein [Halomonas elongata]|uniref:Panacea domain-containing protein n=1 Tax=Halomonas elongata TaxID=2746 RepID=UPI004034F685